MLDWRMVAGYSASRPPRSWDQRWLQTNERGSLAGRLAECAAGEEAGEESIDDLLWLADLADAVSVSYGHEVADIDHLFGSFLSRSGSTDWFDRLPPWIPPPSDDSSESVQLDVADAAERIALGARTPPRPSSWGALVGSLVVPAEGTDYTDRQLNVAAEIAAGHGHTLPGTNLLIEVAMTSVQLARWGASMGNCIAGYSAMADKDYALIALADAQEGIVANVSMGRIDGRWRIQEAVGRRNAPIESYVRERLNQWADQLVATSAVESPPEPEAVVIEGPRRIPRGKRPPIRDELHRAGEQLNQIIKEQGTPRLTSAEAVLRPVATRLRWNGDDDGLSMCAAIARGRPENLRTSVEQSLSGECRFAELWRATGYRPLTSAIVELDSDSPDRPRLRRLSDSVLPRTLLPLLRDPLVNHLRFFELAARQTRLALGALLRQSNAELHRAVNSSPHVGFLTAGAVATTAWGPEEVPDLRPLPVAADGTTPGRPGSSLFSPRGPWQMARLDAAELGATLLDIEKVFASARADHLLVPSAWLGGRGWAALWSRGYRAMREQI